MGTVLDTDVSASLAAALLAISACLLILKPRLALARANAWLVVVGLVVGATSSHLAANGDSDQAWWLAVLGLLPGAVAFFCQQSVLTNAAQSASNQYRIPKSLLRLASRAGLATSGVTLAAHGVPLVEDVSRFVLAILLVTSCAIPCWMLAHAASLSRSPRDRARQSALFAGFALAIGPLALFCAVPVLIFHSLLMPPSVALGCMFCLPLSSAFAAVPLRAGSLTSLADRLSVYALLTIALVLAYMVIAYGLQRAVAYHADLLSQLTMLSFAALAAVTYAPLRRGLQQVVDKALYRDHYDYGETLRRFSQEMAALRSRDELLTALIDNVISTLNLSYAAAIGLPEGLDRRVLALVEEADLMVRGADDDTNKRAQIVSSLANLDLARHALSGERPVLLDPWADCAALVLIGAENAGHGGALLILGPKKTRAALRGADCELLATLSHQATTALSNAALVEGLRTSLAQVQISTTQLVAARAEQQLLVRQLVDSEERQRAALAHDLHDDALQEVLYLVRHSRLAANLAAGLVTSHDEEQLADTLMNEGGKPASQGRTRSHRLQQELSYLAERATVAELRLRSLCLGLYPALLTSVGLIGAAEELAQELSATEDLDVTVTSDDSARNLAEHLDLETSLHIYRVVQEALRNAAKHAGGSAAWLRFSGDSESGGQTSGDTNDGSRIVRHLKVDVEDNGIGMTASIDYAALLRDGHLGLAGMRQRAERIGAALTIQMGVVSGTRVSLRLPVAQTSPTRVQR